MKNDPKSLFESMTKLTEQFNLIIEISTSLNALWGEFCASSNLTVINANTN